MYNAINRIIIPTVIVFALVSCGNSDKDSAAELYSKCENAIGEHRLTEALQLLDTLHLKYQALFACFCHAQSSLPNIRHLQVEQV